MKIRIWFLVCVAIMVSVPAPCQDASWQPAMVRYVKDGDSLVLTDGSQVRLLGVDTPEHKDASRNLQNARYLGVDPKAYAAFSRLSREFVAHTLQHRDIRIEFDPVNKDTGHHDKFERLLLYIWVPADALPESEADAILADLSGVGEGSLVLVREGHVLLNAVLVARGYGYAYTHFPFRYLQAFVALQRNAKERGVGFWQADQSE